MNLVYRYGEYCGWFGDGVIYEMTLYRLQLNAIN